LRPSSFETFKPSNSQLSTFKENIPRYPRDEKIATLSYLRIQPWSRYPYIHPLHYQQQHLSAVAYPLYSVKLMPRAKSSSTRRELCKIFSNGDLCYREAQGGCPYVHDFFIRGNNLKKEKQAALNAVLGTGLRTQASSNTVLTTSTASKPTSGNTNLQIQTPTSTTQASAAPLSSHFTQPRKHCKLYINGEYCLDNNLPKVCPYIHNL
jgi:hypothetical protein